MNAEEFRTAFRILVGPNDGAWPVNELAHELDIPWQDISRAWREGCSGGLAAAMRIASTAKRQGRPWRTNEVAIIVRDGQFVLDIP